MRLLDDLFPRPTLEQFPVHGVIGVRPLALDEDPVLRDLRIPLVRLLLVLGRPTQVPRLVMAHVVYPVDLPVFVQAKVLLYPDAGRRH